VKEKNLLAGNAAAATFHSATASYIDPAPRVETGAPPLPLTGQMSWVQRGLHISDQRHCGGFAQWDDEFVLFNLAASARIRCRRPEDSEYRPKKNPGGTAGAVDAFFITCPGRAEIQLLVLTCLGCACFQSDCFRRDAVFNMLLGPVGSDDLLMQALLSAGKRTLLMASIDL
jgi:hypothetical protein